MILQVVAILLFVKKIFGLVTIPNKQPNQPMLVREEKVIIIIIIIIISIQKKGRDHQDFQVPKMELLKLMRLFFGVAGFFH